jgi:hypothetical protein
MKMTACSKTGHCQQMLLLADLILSGSSACALMIYSIEIAILLYRETGMKPVNISAENCSLYQYYYGILSIKSTETSSLFKCIIFLPLTINSFQKIPKIESSGKTAAL